MLRTMPVAALLLTVVLVGCLAPQPAAPTAPAADVLADAALALVVDHDHFDRAAHSVASGIALRDWQGIEPYGTPSGAHAVDLHEDRLVVALHPLSGDNERGFALFDVSDATAPKLLGRYVDQRHQSGDRTVMFSADGNTVFLGAENAQAKDAMILAVDVSDPAKPKLAAEVLVPPSGPHTLHAAEVGGVQYVYVVSYGLQIYRYTPGQFEFAGRYVAATPTQILKFPDGPDQASTYARRDIYGHDVFAWEDPLDKRHLAFVAYAYDGFKIVDLTNPLVPRELSSWVPETPDAPSYVHTVAVHVYPDGRRIAAVGAETFESRNRDVPSPIWILDVTDLAAPKHLLTWTNPAGAGSSDLLLSAHDMRFDVHDGRTLLWLSHYHAGVWALDVTAPEAPEVLGFYLPNEDQGFTPPENCCRGLRMSGVPLTFDVIGRDGVAYAADMWSGLYTLELE